MALLQYMQANGLNFQNMAIALMEGSSQFIGPSFKVQYGSIYGFTKIIGRALADPREHQYKPIERLL